MNNNEIKWGPIGEDVYRRTYSRKMADGTSETWPDTVARVVAGSTAVGTVKSDEADRLTELITAFKVLPAGRHLWITGTGLPHTRNCLAGETEVVTANGVKSIESLVGRTVTVVDGMGHWVESLCSAYGEQDVCEITLTRYGVKKTIKATYDHGWFTYTQSGNTVEKTTKDLVPGSRLVQLRRSQVGMKFDPSPVGIQRGFIFGDGSILGAESVAYFCGDKDLAMLKWFPCHKITSRNDDVLVANNNPRYYKKETPHLDESTSYLYGWLAGYFAADGCVTDDGTVMIHSSVRSNMEFVRDLCSVLGIGTSPIMSQIRKGYCDTESDIYRLTMNPHDFNSKFFLTESHLERWGRRTEGGEDKWATWTVESVNPAGRELVYCFNVPTTHSFALADGIKTANCFRAPWGTRLADHFEFMADQLLTGGGVGANYSQEYIRQSPQLRHFDLFITCDKSHPDFDAVVAAAGDYFVSGFAVADQNIRMMAVPDNREGWAAGWGALFDAATSNQAYVALDVSDIREAGAEIKTFGGTASGPGPFVKSLVAVSEVIAQATGRWMTSVEAMLCDHHIASAVVAGGARRSARMSIVHWQDPQILEFINCKADHMHHWTTNISVEIDNEFIAKLNAQDNEALRVFSAVVEGMWANGEPGFTNTDAASEGEVGDVRSTNPCVTGDTLVLTEDGLRRADTLLGREINIIVGDDVWATTPEGFFSTGVKDTITLDVDGTSLTVTHDHPIMTVDGWVNAGDLSVGDAIVLGSGAKAWAGTGTSWEGYLLGHLIGDGTFAAGNPVLSSWGVDASVRAHISDITGCAWKPAGRDDKYNLRISRDLTDRYGLFARNKKMTDEIMTASSEFTSALLSALFDTDGHVEGHPKKGGISIRLSQSDSEFLGRVKILLQAHGVRSVVRDGKPAGEVMFKPGQKAYPTKDQYRLIISGESVRTFLDRIGFVNSDKQRKAESLLSEMTRGFYSKAPVSTVRSITEGPTVEVFDCQVPGINAFEANGLVVSNCGEIFLEEGESCNIGSVDLAAYGVDDDGAEEAFRLVARFLVRATLITPYQKLTAEVENRNRRIGVGFLGLQGWAAAHGVRYSDIRHSKHLAAKLDRFREAIRQEADAYCDELGIARCIKVTAIAPNGTISQLRGTQAGMHAVLARHAWRRVRYTFGDPQISEAMDRGLMVEPCIYADNTAVVRYPLRDVILDQYDESLIQQTSDVSLNDQLGVLAFVSEHFCGGTDGNAVSFTADLDRDTIGSAEAAGEIIKSWLPSLKGVTCFPTESRPQSPYEVITKAEYEAAARGEDFTGSAEFECASGACPIK